MEPKNYVEVTRSWYAEHLPFPFNFFLPGQMQRHQLDKLRLLRGDDSLEASEEVEKEVTIPSPPPPSLPSHKQEAVPQTGGVRMNQKSRVLFYFSCLRFFFFFIPLFSFSVLAFPAVRRSWWKNIPEKVNVSQEDRSAWKKNSKV